MPYLAFAQVGRVVVTTGWCFGYEVDLRIQPDAPRVEDPRLQQDVRVFDGDVVDEDVAFAAELLDHAHVVRVKQATPRQPRGVIEAHRVDDQRLAFPPSDEVPPERDVVRQIRIVLAAVDRDDPEILRAI